MGVAYLVFSDLDGTLLDADTYEFTPAREAIKFLKEHQFPLILCSSKTKAEIEVYHKKMGLKTCPFISENGGAIFIPNKNLNLRGFNYQISSGYYVIELGMPYGYIKKCLDKIRQNLQLKLKRLSEMSLEEITAFTNLPPAEAHLAQKRDYSEPFIFEDSPQKLSLLQNALQTYHLNLTKGGRFYTVMGSNDKGRAVDILKTIYQQTYPQQKFISIGLGDSPNDLPLLERVDIPVVVRKKDGSHLSMKRENPYFAQFPGPKGWAEAIFKIIKGGKK